MSKILAIIVEKYVKIGHPIGSKKVCELMGNSISAATIRNDMASLTALGFLEQPHISAGRIPSVNGCRFYVNNLMNFKILSDYEKHCICGMIKNVTLDPESIIQESCDVLSKITKCAVAFAAPPVGDSYVKEIKFVRVGLRTIVLILVTSSGMIQNQIFNCKFEVSSEILEIFKKAVSSKFKGKLLKSLLFDMQKIIFAQEIKDMIIIPAFEATLRAVKKVCQLKTGVRGEKFLFDFEEPSDALSILEVIEKKKFNDFLFSSSNKIKIYVGDDCKMEEFSGCCLAVEKYNVGIHEGAISVISPIRVDYSDIIAKMNYITEIIQSMFSEIMNR